VSVLHYARLSNSEYAILYSLVDVVAGFGDDAVYKLYASLKPTSFTNPTPL